MMRMQKESEKLTKADKLEKHDKFERMEKKDVVSKLRAGVDTMMLVEGKEALMEDSSMVCKNAQGFTEIS